MTDPDRLEYLGQVAAWYYEEDLDQSEIADRIGRSRSMVSRLLAEARDRGLVEIRVRYPLQTDQTLADELKDAYGLEDAIVLSGQSINYDAMVRRLGRLGARALQSRLHSNQQLAIGWGVALSQVVRSMPEIQLKDTMVIQVMGSVGDGDPKVDGSDLARMLASKLNGDFRYLPAPLFVDRPEAAVSLLANRTIARTFEMAREAELVLAGIGAIDSSMSGLVRAGYFPQSDSERLQGLGVVGDFLGHLLDADGVVLDLPENHRVVSLPPSDLSPDQTVIGLAGGVDKARAIAAVLRGRFLNVLVTDETAARVLLSVPTNPTRSKVLSNG